MREIKFRAWTKEEMIYEGWNKNFFVNKEIIFRYDDVMQFTGLKDKNGKEIYEGDIVNAIANDDYHDSSVISDIFFSQDYQWCVRSILSELEIEEVQHGLVINWGGWQSLEVIGNIWENKNLFINDSQLPKGNYVQK